MIRIDRICAVKAYLLSSALLVVPWFLVYWGVPPIWQDRVDPVGPLVPLVSVPEGVAPDIWSSVPGLLRVALSAFQGIVLVELARITLVILRRMDPLLFVATAAYELSLALDWLRIWAADWFIWVFYRLRLTRLCEDPICLPVEGEKPWISLSVLVITLLILWGKRRGSPEAARCVQEKQ